MKNKSFRLVSRFGMGLVFALALAGSSGRSASLPPDKLAFVGLWKTSTGYGLDFNTNGTVRITEDYQQNELKGTRFERGWNSDNVPIEPGPGGSGFFLWNVEFQNDDFLLIYGPGANRRYKINIYPCTETNQTKMILNGMEFIRQEREGLSTPVPPSDPLDLPIANKTLAMRIAGINQTTDQNALAKMACTDKDSVMRKAAFRKLTDPAAIGKVACEAGESDMRWLALNTVTNPDVLVEVARQYHGWDGYLNEAAVERLNDQAALAELACHATNWPGLWTVREHALSKLTNQEMLVQIGLTAPDLGIRKTAYLRSIKPVTAQEPGSTQPDDGKSPVITRVSPIQAKRNQTIVIEGRRFGNAGPKLISMGDAVDTDARNGRWPSLVINNSGKGWHSWEAGLKKEDHSGDLIGVKLVKWSDTNITLAGFGAALGADRDQSTWKIGPGDRIEITVFVPPNTRPAIYATNVVSAPDSGMSK